MEKMRSILKQYIGTKNPELSPETIYRREKTKISPKTIYRVAVAFCPDVIKTLLRICANWGSETGLKPSRSPI